MRSNRLVTALLMLFVAVADADDDDFHISLGSHSVEVLKELANGDLLVAGGGQYLGHTHGPNIPPFALRVSRAGEIVWNRQFEEIAYRRVKWITETSDGFLLLTEGSDDGKLGAGRPADNVAVFRLNPNGMLIGKVADLQDRRVAESHMPLQQSQNGNLIVATKDRKARRLHSIDKAGEVQEILELTDTRNLAFVALPGGSIAYLDPGGSDLKSIPTLVVLSDPGIEQLRQPLHRDNFKLQGLALAGSNIAVTWSNHRHHPVYQGRYARQKRYLVEQFDLSGKTLHSYPSNVPAGLAIPTTPDGGYFALSGTTYGSQILQYDPHNTLIESRSVHSAHAATAANSLIQLRDGSLAITGESWSRPPRVSTSFLQVFEINDMARIFPTSLCTGSPADIELLESELSRTWGIKARHEPQYKAGRPPYKVGASIQPFGDCGNPTGRSYAEALSALRGALTARQVSQLALRLELAVSPLAAGFGESKESGIYHPAFVLDPCCVPAFVDFLVEELAPAMQSAKQIGFQFPGTKALLQIGANPFPVDNGTWIQASPAPFVEVVSALETLIANFEKLNITQQNKITSLLSNRQGITAIQFFGVPETLEISGNRVAISPDRANDLLPKLLVHHSEQSTEQSIAQDIRNLGLSVRVNPDVVGPGRRVDALSSIRKQLRELPEADRQLAKKLNLTMRISTRYRRPVSRNYFHIKVQEKHVNQVGAYLRTSVLSCFRNGIPITLRSSWLFQDRWTNIGDYSFRPAFDEDKEVWGLELKQSSGGTPIPDLIHDGNLRFTKGPESNSALIFETVMQRSPSMWLVGRGRDDALDLGAAFETIAEEEKLPEGTGFQLSPQSYSPDRSKLVVELSRSALRKEDGSFWPVSKSTQRKRWVVIDTENGKRIARLDRKPQCDWWRISPAPD